MLNCIWKNKTVLSLITYLIKLLSTTEWIWSVRKIYTVIFRKEIEFAVLLETVEIYLNLRTFLSNFNVNKVPFFRTFIQIQRLFSLLLIAWEYAELDWALTSMALAWWFSLQWHSSQQSQFWTTTTKLSQMIKCFIRIFSLLFLSSSLLTWLNPPQNSANNYLLIHSLTWEICFRWAVNFSFSF